VPAPADAPAVSRGARWSDLRRRVVSAAVLAPVALACLWLGGWLWVALVVLIAAGLVYEWAALWPPSAGVAGFAGGIGGVLLAALALLWLRMDPVAGWLDTLFLVLVVWTADIAAYLVGRMVGGPKLWPAVSPGKTWSGSIGGLIGASVVGALVAVVAGAPAPGRAAAAALVVALVSQAGDLLESAAKRRRGVKDSGRLIPGHGGLLDRLDSLLAAAPVAALLALAAGRGVVLWG
jgi:phosphatidate cytidylyltransferase